MNTKRRDVSLRIPQDALDRIDQHAKDLRMTRTGYLILAGCQELDHVPIPDNELDEIHRRLEIRRDVHRLHPATEEVRNQSFPRTRHRLGAARVFRDVLAGQRPDPPRPAPTVALTVAAWGHHGSPYGQSREVPRCSQTLGVVNRDGQRTDEGGETSHPPVRPGTRAIGRTATRDGPRRER
jgi:hypothetical protein